MLLRSVCCFGLITNAYKRESREQKNHAFAHCGNDIASKGSLQLSKALLCPHARPRRPLVDNLKYMVAAANMQSRCQSFLRRSQSSSAQHMISSSLEGAIVLLCTHISPPCFSLNAVISLFFNMPFIRSFNDVFIYTIFS